MKKIIFKLLYLLLEFKRQHLIIYIKNGHQISKWTTFFRKLRRIEISIHHSLCILTFCGILITAMTILLLILNTFYISKLFIEAADVAKRKTHRTSNPEVQGLILNQDIFIQDTISVAYTLFLMIDKWNCVSPSFILITDSCENVISHT